MKPLLAFFLVLLAASADAREPWPVWISFPEADLQRNKRAALRAINSPEEWRRFPREKHERRYTPILREIGFAFSQTKKEGDTVTVIIPTTASQHIHRTLIYVTFNGRGEIIGLSEVPEI